MFKPGSSGNPGGRPDNAFVRHLARRYTVDWMIACVETVRLRQPAYANARMAAAKELRLIGYGKLEDEVEAEAQADALHLHLLAVNTPAALPEPTPPLAPDPEPPAATVETEPVVIDMELLPDPAEDVPGAALPLWENYRARRREADAAQRDAAAAEPATEHDPATPAQEEDKK